MAEEDVSLCGDFVTGNKMELSVAAEVAPNRRYAKVCMTHDQVKSWLTDGSLEVTVKVSMAREPGVSGGMETHTKHMETHGKHRVSSVSPRIFDTLPHPDLTLPTTGDSLPCTASSPVLETLSGSKVQEESLDIQCSAVVGRELVRFLYTGDMEEEVLTEEVELFLKFGEVYGMDTLKQKAEHKMVEMLNTENMVTFFLAGDLYKAELIRERAKELLKQNLATVKVKEGWEEPFGDRKELLIELLVDECI